MGDRRRRNTTFFIVSVFAVVIAIILSIIFAVDKEFSKINDQIYVDGSAPVTLEAKSSGKTTQINQKDNLSTNYVAAFDHKDNKLNWYALQTTNGGLQTYDIKSDSSGNVYALMSFNGEQMTAYNSNITDSDNKVTTSVQEKRNGFLRKSTYQGFYFADDLTFFLKNEPTSVIDDVSSVDIEGLGGPNTSFTLMYTGFIQPIKDITVTFKTTSNDSSLVFLSDSGNIMKEISEFDITNVLKGNSSGILKVNNKGLHGTTGTTGLLADTVDTQTSEEISLEKDKVYQLVVIYGKNEDADLPRFAFEVNVDGNVDSLAGSSNDNYSYYYHSNCTALLKYSVNGEIEWISELKTSGNYKEYFSDYDIPQKLYIDDNDNLYVTGVYDGILTCSSAPGMNESRTLTDSGENSFVAKYTNEGKVLWAASQNFDHITISQLNSDFITVVGINIEDNENIVAKSSYGILEKESSSAEADRQLLGIVKYNSHTGVVDSDEVLKVLKASSFDNVVATDNNIILVKYSGVLSEDEPQNTNIAENASNQYSLIRFSDDLESKHLWNVQLDGDNTTHPMSIHTDDYGDVYISGNFNTSIDIKDSSDTTRATLSGTGVNGFIAKYTDKGKFLSSTKLQQSSISDPIKITSISNRVFTSNKNKISEVNFDSKIERVVLGV